VSDETLTAETYCVLERVPRNWWDEIEVEREIATALHLSVTSVQRRIGWLLHMKLVERRTGRGIVPSMEIRKVGR